MTEKLFTLEQYLPMKKDLPTEVEAAIRLCITSAFGQEMPEDEVVEALEAERVLVARTTRDGEIVGFAAVSRMNKLMVPEGIAVPEGAKALDYGAAAIMQDYHGQGVYGLLNAKRLEYVLQMKGNVISTKTQNPKVEGGISTSLRRAVENKQIKSATLARVKMPGFYGRKLTSYPIDRTGTVFEDLDVESGDAFNLIFSLLV